MAGRKPPRLPEDEAGYTERIIRAQKRTVSALSTKLAQDSVSPIMGTRFHLQMQENLSTGDAALVGIRFDEVDEEHLRSLASRLRPFQLKNEAIYWVDLVAGLKMFASGRSQSKAVEQLPNLWRACSVNRMYAYAGDLDRGELIPGGVGESVIGNRFLYSEHFHADPRDDFLEYIEDPWQLWSVASLVGNWLAMVAHQQYVMNMVRSDLVPELTQWAGNPRTIFDRIGATVRPFADP